MKKTAVAAARVIAVSVVLVFTTFSVALANTPLLDRTLSLAGLSSELTTPDQIAKYMWRHFLFEQDQRQFGKEDYWQTPEEFLQRGKGDCEDFASFAAALLKRNGVNTFILNVYGNGFGHTVVVFEEKGTYQVIDGTDIIRHKAGSLKELLEKIYPFWKTGAIVTASPAGKTGIILQTITR